MMNDNTYTLTFTLVSEDDTQEFEYDFTSITDEIECEHSLADCLDDFYCRRMDFFGDEYRVTATVKKAT